MFPPRRPLPTLRRFCRCGPSGPRIPLIPAPLPAQISTILRRERLPLPLVTSHQSQITKSFRISIYAKPTRNPFRIRTSKTQDLKPFRMNTSKKTGEGEGQVVHQLSDEDRYPEQHRYDRRCRPCRKESPSSTSHESQVTSHGLRFTLHLAFSAQCALLLVTP